MPEISDYSGISGCPITTFLPESVESLIDFLKSHPKRKFRLGAGLTGVSGGAVPFDNEIFIDLSGFTSIEWYDESSGILSVESGVTMMKLRDFARSAGWEFPVIPGSLERATLGGMIACNGGGPMSLKFGKVGNYLLELDVITSTGERVKVGAAPNKTSQGICDKMLWVGSEGTLGIIHRALVRCIPMLPELHYYRIASEELFHLMDSIPSLLKLDPYVLELASSGALKFSSARDEHVVWVAFSKEVELVLSSEFRITKHSSDALTERFSIGYNLQNYKPFVDLDVSFPLKNASSALRRIEELLNQHNLEHVIFGHGGDANYHLHLFFNKDREVWESVVNDFDAIVSSFDGVISGEHGIGRIHKERFLKAHSLWQKEIYLHLKQFTDPYNQLPSLL
ncbi:MAG: FAD-binding oxidoreductase [Cryomorphaceae bacterium]|jgi:FAD/FMN-containing dehydrogenase|nr:FAD-binding oxidoreductase [Cryomorphaceae bacterium]